MKSENFPKEIQYIATLSGGKDSTAMVDLLLKNKYPVDYILFYDTLLEHEDMYAYIEKLKIYFMERYKKEIIVLKPKRADFIKDYVLRKRVKGEFKGYLNGFLAPNVGFCHWRTFAKIEVEKAFIKKMKISNYKIYIGFTLEEARRANRDSNFIYPLIDDFKMKENDCKEYLIQQEMENPLYRHFTRTGCSICPFQSDKHWFNIWKHYPKVWDSIKEIEVSLSKEEYVVNRLAFGKVSVFQKEKEFSLKDREKSLFEFSDEPLKDCFCKI